MNLFQLKNLPYFSKEIQIIFIVFLFIVTTIHRYKIRSQLRKEENEASVHFAYQFAPIYEEIMFRGLLFQGLLVYYPFIPSLVISSVLFGIWHLKNIFYLGLKKTLIQSLYAGIVFGPLVTFICYFTHTIWIGVIVHYLNNLWAYYQWEIYKKVGIYKFVKGVKI